MAPTYLWRVVFILLLTPALVPGQRPAASQRESDDARAILEKVGSTYRAASSLELKSTQIQTDDNPDNNIDRMTITLITAGDKFRWEQESKAGTFINASDGNQHWMYNESSKQKYTLLEGKSVDPFEFGFQVNLRTPASQLKEARIVGEEVLQTGQGKRACVVIEARYEGPRKGYPQTEFGATTFWIDRESNLVWKMSVPIVTDFGKMGKIRATETTVYSSIRMNLTVPPETFAPTREVKTDSELDKAQASAERCLAETATLKSDKDINIHRCNLILGGVALRRGDLKRAGEYLLIAARIGGTGPSAGPNMILAKELLEKGQRDVVLEYFQLCGKSWSAGRGQLARWTAQVKAGEIPQFGANLAY